MIQGYYILKKHCNTPYNIDQRKFNVGNLTDKQLTIAKKVLSTRKDKTELECRQLEAVNYVTDYRSQKALEKIENEASKSMHLRLKSRAKQQAKIISTWIEASYKNTN